MTIGTLGEQRGGITHVEQVFVVIVADIEPSKEVTIEIDSVKSTVAFTSIVSQSN